ncbi:hypothetical protein VHA01S_087_00030 [Vibrio halioticoli NBRC 102217]|uniref:Uncharacterized protein n=1 Tax=Vibrio halioticoli NBRC 102217 TaxID=1219072 RepID=V5FI40_9VIBR|nr:hypothetical protein VHA01S_087_00030 [Vibrio halioticoli NBRC 102217]
MTRVKLIQFISQQESTTIAMEACCGAHWLARKCKEYGHQIKLIPAQYVKPYVKSHKNDFIDADAIAEATSRTFTLTYGERFRPAFITAWSLMWFVS